MKKAYIKLIDNRITIFVFAFLLMAFYIFPQKDMFMGSGDAVETWKVVTTFLSSNPEHSYVMYKGFLSIIPNVIFYQLALLFKVDQFFFLKVFNCISFAYICAIGLPYLFSYILNIKISNFKVYILTIILFLGIGINFAFLSVDAPSVLVMLLTINSAVKISEKKLPFIYYIYTGIVFSMCTSYSGQYFPAVICALLFIIFGKFIPMLKKKEVSAKIISVLVCFVLGFSLVRGADNYFIKTRVQPVREAGQWLPKGEDWLKYSLTKNLMFSKYSNLIRIPDNRGTTILIRENKDIDLIEKGGYSYEFKEYFGLILKYPFDFLIRWLNRLFLGISIDKDETNFYYLLNSYTLLFLCLLTFKKKCKYIKDVFNNRAFLILALILPSLVPCLTHVEMRYFMSIQILIAGTALYSDTLWNGLLGFKKFINKNIINRKNLDLSETLQVNYTFSAYIIFIIFCFLLIAAQYEHLGVNNTNMFFTF